MRRALVPVSVVIGGLLAATFTAAPASAAPPSDDRWEVYTGRLSPDDLDRLVDLGVDRRELQVAPVDGTDEVQVEVTATEAQAEALAKEGVELEPKLVDGLTASALADEALEDEGGVFRQYSGPGGLQEELAQQAAAHPRIAELVTIGQTWQGQDINAVRVTRNPTKVEQGSRPTTVFNAAQHAREWITPEMVRRLLDLVLDSYGTDERITELVDTTEMWFIPVANPDGYDYTFTEGNREWRKNLRDNDGDGEITAVDGVDPNRNFPTRWGYDNEGSSPNPTSLTYRGPAPASEPETQALDGLFARITPEFLVNYHSAAELLLYGVGWQVATPTPDDNLYVALAGDDAEPAVPGYDPDISAELYTTNGETTEHMQAAYGTLGFTPEMSTCQTISDAVPDDEWLAEDCGSVFTFPDDEELIQEEFEKNVPFALAVAESALDPDDPVSVVGREAPDFVVDTFDVSYGDPQVVAVEAKRALRDLEMRYRINGERRTYVVGTEEWQGGERYGDTNDRYYGEFRGEVTGAEPGDTVEVWFRARKPGEGRIESERFTYTLAADSGNRVLVLANEDYTGVNPEQAPSGATGPAYAQAHVDALAAAGYAADVWDVDAQGVPHDLGVLGHYDAVLWYLGDNRLTQDPEDFLTEYGSGAYPDSSVAERQQYLTIAVRDYLNEGGRLVHSGETTAFYGFIDGAIGLGGIYYGLDGAPEEPCAVTADPYSDCLLLADDFTQYYLGAYDRSPVAEATGVAGTGTPFEGASADLAGPASNPVDEAGNFIPLNSVLPQDQFPWFGSTTPSSEYLPLDPTFLPVEGEWYVGAVHEDDSWTRLTRTIDLTGVTAAQAPTLRAQLSSSTEEAYDFALLEARTVGGDDWTTLSDANGGTTSDVPADCEQGFLLELHPFLTRYLTPGDPCTAGGTSGDWNAFTGESGGWQEVAFDLSAYAGSTVEVSFSFVTDPAFAGTGVFVDDTRVEVGGQVVESEGFETGLGAWTISGAPEGSPPTVALFERSQQLVLTAASITTEDSVLLGFGFEQIPDAAVRAEWVGRAVGALIGPGTPAP